MVDEIQQQNASDSSPANESRSNPLATGLNVLVSVPETIEIKMVEASTLGDYEIWILIASILASAVVGFVVAYVQDTNQDSLLYTGIVFGVLFVIAFAMAVFKRHKLRSKSRSVHLETTEVASRRSERKT